MKLNAETRIVDKFIKKAKKHLNAEDPARIKLDALQKAMHLAFELPDDTPEQEISNKNLERILAVIKSIHIFLAKIISKPTDENSINPADEDYEDAVWFNDLTIDKDDSVCLSAITDINNRLLARFGSAKATLEMMEQDSKKAECSKKRIREEELPQDSPSNKRQSGPITYRYDSSIADKSTNKDEERHDYLKYHILKL